MQRRSVLPLLGLLVLFTAVSSAQAASTCEFKTAGSVMILTADCTTDTTILIPNGYTLDGRNHTITATDPEGGHFLGAVVRNSGALAHVTKLRITTAGLANVCDSGLDQLRGILFDGASGTIQKSTISHINQGASACPEGNGIVVQNFSTNGTVPPVQTVKITGNRISAYQHSGIVCDGYVNCLVRSNVVGASAAQANQPANSIEIRYGAHAVVEKNDVSGNSWTGSTNYVSTAILLRYAAVGTLVRGNRLREGNADIGIYAYTDGATVENNRVYESGQDLNKAGWDVGIYVYSPANKSEVSTTNTVANNKVRGYLLAFNTPELGTHEGGKVIAKSHPTGE